MYKFTPAVELSKKRGRNERQELTLQFVDQLKAQLKELLGQVTINKCGGTKKPPKTAELFDFESKMCLRVEPTGVELIAKELSKKYQRGYYIKGSEGQIEQLFFTIGILGYFYKYLQEKESLDNVEIPINNIDAQRCFIKHMLGWDIPSNFIQDNFSVFVADSTKGVRTEISNEVAPGCVAPFLIIKGVSWTYFYAGSSPTPCNSLFPSTGYEDASQNSDDL